MSLSFQVRRAGNNELSGRTTAASTGKSYYSCRRTAQLAHLSATRHPGIHPRTIPRDVCLSDNISALHELLVY